MKETLFCKAIQFHVADIVTEATLRFHCNIFFIQKTDETYKTVCGKDKSYMFMMPEFKVY